MAYCKKKEGGKYNIISLTNRYLEKEMIMNYETRPCVEDDEEFIEEKLDTIENSIVPPEEGAEDENLVFRITDNGENLILLYRNPSFYRCSR